MKYGLIKKSIICVLSLSCLATLASCGIGGSSTKVFANKDIQAYAKKNDITNEIGDIELKEIKLNDYTIVENKFAYTLVRHQTTDKYKLFIRYSNVTYDIPTDEDEYIVTDGISNLSDLDNSYGYYVISFNTNKKMLIDYNGNVLVNKDKYNSITFVSTSDRIMNYESQYTGKKKFYDFIHVTDIDGTKTKIFEINANYKKGLITDFTRNELYSEADVDYSIIDLDESAHTSLKKYNFYTTTNAFYVKDLKGNLVNSASLSFDDIKYYVLDDKLFYQTYKTVDINDKYTYYNGSDFYQLETYSIDLKTGKKEKLKNYKYAISSTTYIKGYNEKEDREYVAAVYARLNKIENKKLSLEETTAMLDKKGNILSSKLGEKGTNLMYFDDKTYVLYEDMNLSFISNTGKVKGTFDATGDDLEINYYNKQIFMYSDEDYAGFEEGLFVDSDLKLITDPKVLPYSKTELYSGSNRYTGFKNGCMLLEQAGNLFLAKVENGEVKILDEFDEFSDDYDLTDYTPDNYRRIFVSNSTVKDSLIFSNLYIVIIENDDRYTVEIHSANGDLLKEVKNVTDLTINTGTQFVISIETAAGTTLYGANYIKAYN